MPDNTQDVQRKTNSFCKTCEGFIGEPNVAYGYAGKWCHCARTNTPPQEENKGEEYVLDPMRYAGRTDRCICMDSTCDGVHRKKSTPPNKQPDSKYAEGYKQGRFDAEMDRLNTKQPEAWQRTFLNAGTEKGLGDLSMMVGVVSEIITSQRASDVRRFQKIIRKERETWARESIGDKALQSLENALLSDDK